MGGFDDAKDSIRAKTKQLTTMRGIKIPRESLIAGGAKACIKSCTIVTAPATITIKAATRISLGINLRKQEITADAPIETAAVAIPIYTPFIALVVTASSGHRARSCTKVGFSSITPLFKSL
jgi:hypothetical protein